MGQLTAFTYTGQSVEQRRAVAGEFRTAGKPVCRVRAYGERTSLKAF